MQRILIGMDIEERDSKFRISAAAGIEQEALSKSKQNNIYSQREPILLTSTGITSNNLESGVRACVHRLIEKLYLQRVFSDTNISTKKILIITKPKHKNLILPFPHAVANKYVLITVARTLDKDRAL